MNMSTFNVDGRYFFIRVSLHLNEFTEKRTTNNNQVAIVNVSDLKNVC